jgi:ubiquinone/menaquinone biosynthesis C-methylase UbiE
VHEMAEHVCPWWLGYLLASPMRRWLMQSPEEMLGPFVRQGMTVLEPGPGMGFFTLPLAQMVGPEGRVVAVDIQAKMIEGLRRRAVRSGLIERIETRLAQPDRMALEDLKGAVDFVLAFAVVHEIPSAEAFFREAANVLKPGGLLFFAEPSGHVTPEAFQRELDAAQAAELEAVTRPAIRRSHAVVLGKGCPGKAVMISR